MTKHFKIVLAFLAVSFILFSVPYLFSETEPSQSVSYMVGFNNKAAVIILFSIAFLVFLTGRKNQKGVEVWMPKPFHIDNVVVNTILISFFLIELIGYLFCSPNFFGFSEGSYFMHYVYAVDNGARLYSDVQFIYGPLCVYPVYLLHTLGITKIVAYYIILGLFHAIGLLLGYYILLKLNLSTRERTFIFVLIAIILFPYSQGLNNGTLRYVIAPFFITNCILNFKKRNLRLNCFFIFLGSLLTLLYSPEIGLCFICAISIWLLSDIFVNKQFDNVFPLIACTFPLIIIVLLYPDYLSSIIQACAGGSNFPFIPSLPLLLLFLSVFTIAFYIGFQTKDLKAQMNYVGIEILLLSLILAATGRCDPYHILAFGVFLIVISYIVVIHFFNKRLVRACFLIAALAYFPFKKYYIANSIQQIKRSNMELVMKVANYYVDNEFYGYEKIAKKISSHSKKQNEFQSPLNYISGSVTSIGVDNSTYVFLCENKDYKDTYFGHTPQWIGTKAGFEREIESLKSVNADYLVLPTEYEKIWLHSNDYSAINLLFFTYYPIRPYRYYNKYLYGDLIAYIKQNYKRISENEVICVLRQDKTNAIR